MVLAVVGSRNFKNRERVYAEIRQLMAAYPKKITHIVSGGAVGPDQFGVDFAKKNGLRYIVHEADWHDFSEPCLIKYNSEDGTVYNALAGFKRNSMIVEDADLILAFWDGKSRGTLDTITKARTESKPIKIIKLAHY